MPHTLEWLIDKRVLHVQISGDVPVPELTEIGLAVREWTDSGTAPVFSVIDLREVKQYPTRLTDLASAFSTKPSAKLGWIVLISNSSILRYITSVVVQLARQHVSTFADYTSALEFLAKQDRTLDLQPVIERFSS